VSVPTEGSVSKTKSSIGSSASTTSIVTGYLNDDLYQYCLTIRKYRQFHTRWLEKNQRTIPIRILGHPTPTLSPGGNIYIRRDPSHRSRLPDIRKRTDQAKRLTATVTREDEAETIRMNGWIDTESCIVVSWYRMGSDEAKRRKPQYFFHEAIYTKTANKKK
jgi:hypothetical protein